MQNPVSACRCLAMFSNLPNGLGNGKQLNFRLSFSEKLSVFWCVTLDCEAQRNKGANL